MGKGAKIPTAGQPQAARQLKMSSSSLGQVIPPVYGEMRMPSNLLFGMFFTAIEHEGGPSGGKGGGRGVFVQYTYTISALLALCEGPLWADEDVPCSHPQQIVAIGRATPGRQVITISDKTGNETKVQPIEGWSPAVWKTKKVRRVVNDAGKSPIPGDPDGEIGSDGDDKDTKSGFRACRWHNWDEDPDSDTPVTGTARFVTNPTGLVAGPATGGVPRVVYDFIRGAWKNSESPKENGVILPQRSAYIVQAGEGYIGISCAARMNMRLGSNASLPNWNFPVRGLCQYRDMYPDEPGGKNGPADEQIFDADPACMLLDMLTNPKHGGGWNKPAFARSLQGYPNPWGARLTDAELAAAGASDSWSAYCRAFGILISWAPDNQRALSDIVTDLAEITNSAPLWSEGRFKMIPYGDTAHTSAGTGGDRATGVTFTPNTDRLGTTDGANISVRYSLKPEHFIPGKNKDAVQVETRTVVPDVRGDYKSDGFYNHVRAEFVNAANGYAVEIVEAKDDASIQEVGLVAREPDVRHEFTNAAAAQAYAERRLQKFAVVRNIYRFTLGWWAVLLEPMDCVTLTEPGVGLDNYKVRITSVSEDKDGNLEFEAEDFQPDVAATVLPAPLENPTIEGDGDGVIYGLLTDDLAGQGGVKEFDLSGNTIVAVPNYNAPRAAGTVFPADWRIVGIDLTMLSFSAGPVFAGVGIGNEKGQAFGGTIDIHIRVGDDLSPVLQTWNIQSRRWESDLPGSTLWQPYQQVITPGLGETRKWKGVVQVPANTPATLVMITRDTNGLVVDDYSDGTLEESSSVAFGWLIDWELE